MKFKKIISLMLACSMILCLAGCGKKSSQELDEIDEAETSISIEDKSSYVATDENADSDAPIIVLDDFKETVVTDRPAFVNMSDYVSMPDGYRDIEVLDATKSNVTFEGIKERIKKDCIRNNIQFTSAADLTNEQAATISDQKYQTVNDYINAVIDQLVIKTRFDYDTSIFCNMLASIADDIECNGFPEDVYAYDTSDSQMLIYGMGRGISYNEMCEVINEKGYGYEKYIAFRENDLYTEMIIMRMVEDAGITEPSDQSYNILMASQGYFNYNDLYNDFTVDQLIEELYTITLIEDVMSDAKVLSFEEYYGYDLDETESETQEEIITADEFLEIENEISEQDESVSSEETELSESSDISIESDNQEGNEDTMNEDDLFGEIEIVG